MAKRSEPPAAASTAKRRPGRPPKPGGRTPQVEVQRAYRARLKAAGKVVRVVDPTITPTAIPDFDPTKDGVYEREMVNDMRDDLRNALLQLELRKRDVADLRKRNAELERELRLETQHLTNATKDIVMLKQQLAQQKPPKQR